MDGFYPKTMTPTYAKKSKSAIPTLPMRKRNTSDATQMKNKKIIGKQFYACKKKKKQPKRKAKKIDAKKVFPTNEVNPDLFLNDKKMRNLKWDVAKKGEKSNANEIFPTNEVNTNLFSNEGDFIKIKVADQDSKVTKVSC